MLHLNLNWLRTFEAVARRSGFTAASRELGLTQTAVSLQIKALETKLGQDLFVRKTKSLELTEIAKAYLPSVRNALEALNMSTNGLFGPDLKSTIVVHGSMAIMLWLVPRLQQFQSLQPGIGIKLVTTIWTTSPDTRNSDIDIVLAPNANTDNRYKKLSEESIVPICSLSQQAEICGPSDLLAVNPIHVLGYDDHWARYLAASGLRYNVRNANFIADTAVAACELAAADLGAAIIIERFAKSAVKMGQRIAIVGDPVPLEQSHYVVVNDPNEEKRFAVNTFKDWLHTQFD